MSMSRYKIIAIAGGFAIWTMKDMGGGYAWVDTGRRFTSRDDAQAFIDAERGRD